MSEGKQKLLDTPGDYLYAVKNGNEVSDPSWRSCRIILTADRLVLSTNGNKQAIPYTKIQILTEGSPEYERLVPDESDVARATATATPFKIGENVIVVDAQHVDDFTTEYCKIALHDAVILAKCSAVVGGVVQGDAEWSKARFRLENEEIKLGLPGNKTVSFPLEDVGTVERVTQQVMGDRRAVVQVEHTNEEGMSVETHFSGGAWHTSTLATLLGRIIDARENDHELSDMENQVLMALYSGVSPFEMAEFVGISVDEVEEIYQHLLAVGAVDEVRTRTEVSLNAHGRNLASEAMNEQ